MADLSVHPAMEHETNIWQQNASLLLAKVSGKYKAALQCDD